MGATRPGAHRLQRMRERTGEAGRKDRNGAVSGKPDASVDCGWGRLVFAQTFSDNAAIVAALREEGADRRDIAFHVRDPHVLLALAPQDLFLDPSHTYRLDLSGYRTTPERPRGFLIRRLASPADAAAVNRIYAAHGMVTVDADVLWRKRNSRVLTLFLAEDAKTGEVIGTVTGVDHARAFDDPEHGASLWCLAVDPRATHPEIGERLSRHLAEHFQARGASWLDLSVLHDNTHAIALYERLGFHRVPLFAVKRRNPINEKLFCGLAPGEAALNPYGRIITEAARRRGIQVEVLDAEGGFFRLTFGGRSLVCRESLSELTTAVAMSRCDDKAVTRRLMTQVGLPCAEAVSGDDRMAALALLDRAGAVVVKPARGEQGRGVTVGIDTEEGLDAAIAAARAYCPDVLVETFAPGDDLRVVVIDGEVVAAALRKRPAVTGDGSTPLRKLIAGLSRRRSAATGGESSIPLDVETERCVRSAGFGLDDAPPAGAVVEVRKTANLHTGGTLHDVTDILHPAIAGAAVAATRAISIPVAGIDFIVDAPDRENFVFIEANERPGLANHEPQPTAERFIDLLFPQTARPPEGDAAQ